MLPRHRLVRSCMVALLLPALPSPNQAANPAPWTPPPQTKQQAVAFRRAAAAAKTASAAATPALLSALALPSVKAALAGCGASDLAALPAQQLLDRVDAEVAVIETVHGLPSLGFDNEFGRDSDFLYNLWQIPLLAPAVGALSGVGDGHDCYPLTDILRVNASVCTEFGWENSKADSFPQVPTCKWQTSSSMCVNTVPAGLEAVETGVYGFPKFKVRGAPENFQEASNRLVYAAFNLQRLDTGSSGVFGGIGLVFRPSYIRNMTQLAPTDTGLYAGCLLHADPGLSDPSGIAICSQQQNATACNGRYNCDWIDSSNIPGGNGGMIVNRSGVRSNGTQAACVDVYCLHWKTQEACSKYSGIGCTWHTLKHTCTQINPPADSAAGLPALATGELRGTTLRTLGGQPLGEAAAAFPTPPTLGCGGWGGPPFPIGTLDDNHHLFLPNAHAWAHENATGPKSQAELGSRLCRLFNPSATEVSVSLASFICMCVCMCVQQPPPSPEKKPEAMIYGPMNTHMDSLSCPVTWTSILGVAAEFPAAVDHRPPNPRTHQLMGSACQLCDPCMHWGD
eukprot:COSAG01_NODE_2442_length_7689_cov_89.459289_8_plen_566_part_00